VAGGYINDAFRVTLADGSDAFVKTRGDAVDGEYAAEAAGLAWLAAAGALRVPRALELGGRYLALEWIDTAPEGALAPGAAEELGRALAVTHLAGAPCFGLPHGWGERPWEHAGAPAVAWRADRADEPPPARFGAISLSNEPAAEWPEFYAERRLLPLARAAAARGALSAGALAAVERVCGRLGELCGAPEPPARLHGDLWGGNVLVGRDGHAWVIDPSTYGGHREVDLAMLRLFGGVPARVLAAYHEQAPLADGWEQRVELYQLLPLLLHAALFAGAYGAAAERAARRYC